MIGYGGPGRGKARELWRKSWLARGLGIFPTQCVEGELPIKDACGVDITDPAASGPTREIIVLIFALFLII